MTTRRCSSSCTTPSRSSRSLLRSIERHLPPGAAARRRRLGLRATAARSSPSATARASCGCPDNPGFGAANVAGLAHVRTPVTVLLNPDVELLDDGVARLVADRRAHATRSSSPRLLNADGSVQRSAHPMPGTAERAAARARAPAPAAAARSGSAADPWRSDAPRRVGWAIAAALAARTDTLRRLGPFDPDAFLFFEDLELCLRAAAAGVPTELHPEIALRHAGGHSTRAGLRRRAPRPARPTTPGGRRQRTSVARALALDDLAQGLTFATRGRSRTAAAAASVAQLRALVQRASQSVLH